MKRLVELHAGSVAAYSDGRGIGSEFLVRLPIPTSPARAKSPGVPDDRLPEAVGRERTRVVDNNNDGATSLAIMLSTLGYDTQTADDGLAGFDFAAEFRLDVALLDIGMPKTNGYELARRIREQPWGKDTLLIAVTGWGQPEDQQRSREAGFDHHLIKPVDPPWPGNVACFVGHGARMPARQTLKWTLGCHYCFPGPTFWQARTAFELCRPASGTRSQDK